MPSFNLDALLFALAWAVLAIVGAARSGWVLGIALLVALMLIVMPVSALVISRSGDLARERQIRWALFAAAVVVTWLAARQG
jgi:hypothetical protein